jgi:hypothetical protein
VAHSVELRIYYRNLCFVPHARTRNISIQSRTRVSIPFTFLLVLSCVGAAQFNCLELHLYGFLQNTVAPQSEIPYKASQTFMLAVHEHRSTSFLAIHNVKNVQIYFSCYVSSHCRGPSVLACYSYEKHGSCAFLLIYKDRLFHRYLPLLLILHTFHEKSA